MKRVYELDVYNLAEELSDMVWHDFDKWNKKVQNTGVASGALEQARHNNSPKRGRVHFMVFIPYSSEKGRYINWNWGLVHISYQFNFFKEKLVIIITKKDRLMLIATVGYMV